MSYVSLVEVNLKFTKALNIRRETFKFPEENMKHFSISELVRVFFLKPYPQIMEIKSKGIQMISHQPHNLLHNKGQNQSSKEKFFTLISRMEENMYIRTLHNPTEKIPAKMHLGLNRYFSMTPYERSSGTQMYIIYHQGNSNQTHWEILPYSN